MPFNLIKQYPELLEILHLSEYQRQESLRQIFIRDIEENDDFKFRGVQIYPIKTDGRADMSREFMHLTTERVKLLDEEGRVIQNNVFEPERSKRLHWINHHVHERTPSNVKVFSIVERDQEKRQSVKKTYIYDKVQKYIIVLEHQRGRGYYLLTAYYLNRPYAEKQIIKKMKHALPEVK